MQISKKIKFGLFFIAAIIIFIVVLTFCKRGKTVTIENPNLEEKLIFETNLPDIDTRFDNNLFIFANSLENTLKSIKIKVSQNGKIQEIRNVDIENIIISNYQDFKDENKTDYFIIRALELKNDKDVGIVHKQIDPKDFKNLSGYVLDEDFVSERKNLCISTSFVYNNWVCFIYDKEKNNFILSYAQNFSD